MRLSWMAFLCVCMGGWMGCGSDTAATRSPIPTQTHGRIINVQDYGARGIGIDDSAALAAAVSEINGLGDVPTVLYFPQGVYALNPQHGMEPRTGLVITASNVEIMSDNATVELLPGPIPYNEVFRVPPQTTFYFNYFKILGSNVLVHDMTFDSKGMTKNGPYQGQYGNFWATALDVKGTAGQSQSDVTVTHNHFNNLGGWVVASTWENNLTISDNHATLSEGMICGNYVNGCTITGNVSENALDAHFASNGATTGATTQNVVISGNTGTGNSNGAGIDVSASTNVKVENNVISGNENWCIEVGKSKNSYREGGAYLPSQNVTVRGNQCAHNGVYQGWPMNAEIFVGDQYSGTNGAPVYKPGDVVSGVVVQNNTTVSDEPQGRGVWIGYGAAEVTVDSNQFSGCGGTVACEYPKQPVIRIEEIGTKDLTVTNNEQDSQFPTAYIYLGHVGPYTVAGNDMIVTYK